MQYRAQNGLACFTSALPFGDRRHHTMLAFRVCGVICGVSLVRQCYASFSLCWWSAPFAQSAIIHEYIYIYMYDAVMLMLRCFVASREARFVLLDYFLVLISEVP